MSTCRTVHPAARPAAVPTHPPGVEHVFDVVSADYRPGPVPPLLPSPVVSPTCDVANALVKGWSAPEVSDQDGRGKQRRGAAVRRPRFDPIGEPWRSTTT